MEILDFIGKTREKEDRAVSFAYVIIPPVGMVVSSYSMPGRVNCDMADLAHAYGINDLSPPETLAFPVFSKNASDIRSSLPIRMNRLQDTQDRKIILK